MLDLEQLKHLQKLSNINLAQEQQEIFLGNLKWIIQMLDNLWKLDLSNVNTSLNISNTLRTIKESKYFPYKKQILDNVEHELINNSVKIKGAI